MSLRNLKNLQENTDKKWILNRSTDPQVTTRDPLTPADKQALSAASPGAQTIELISVYSPVGLAQNTVLVKGLFIDRAAGMRINVTSMELIHLDCRK